jgi:hypothetical protein
MEVEAYRQKQVRPFFYAPRTTIHSIPFQGHSGDRHADRAAKQFEQQQIDMLNSKKYSHFLQCRFTLPTLSIAYI